MGPTKLDGSRAMLKEDRVSGIRGEAGVRLSATGKELETCSNSAFNISDCRSCVPFAKGITQNYAGFPHSFRFSVGFGDLGKRIKKWNNDSSFARCVAYTVSGLTYLLHGAESFLRS